MKKIFLTAILALVSTMGAWATAYRGAVSIDQLYTACKSGDSIAMSSQLVNSDETRYYSQYAVHDPVIDNYFGVDMNYTQPFSDFISDAAHSNYRLLNPNAVVEEYFVVSSIINIRTGVLIQPLISGRLSGFYTQAEMADALDAVREAMTYKVDDATLAGYKADVNNAVITDARSIYDNRRALILQYDANQRAQEQERLRLLAEAKEAAIAEINAALGDITDATLLATIQGYKDQINAATVIEAIAPIKTEALAAIDAYKVEQERLRLLAEAKEEAIADIDAAIMGETRSYILTVAENYIAQINAATVIETVTDLRTEALDVLTPMINEPTAFSIHFTSTGNPVETEHMMAGTRFTFGGEDGELMQMEVNGATVTYPLSQVASIEHFRGTPAVELTTHENPADPGFYYTTFYSGLEAYAIPEDVKAFTAELNFAGDALIVTQITSGVLPQDEGVLLESTSADAITLGATDPSLGTKAGSNVFRGSDVYINNRPAGTTYVVSAADNVMAFYQYTGSVIPANKAYMNLPAGQSAPRRIVWSTEHTGVATGTEHTAATDQAEKFLHNGTLYIRKGEHVYNVQGVLVR